MLELVFLLLPIAALSGWYIGKKHTFSTPSDPTGLSSDYYAGLNFLLNEQTDKAVDAFIRMLEVSPDSVETTLALGHFFRRRGEVDRAIRVHQNVISKPHLSISQRNQSLLALAQDYVCAGVYDRAESLFLQISQEGEERTLSLRHLLDIYEREKEWEKAIEIAKRCEVVDGKIMHPAIAHYYCELAELAWSKGKIRTAFKHLKQGLQCDPNCARVSLLQGNFQNKLGKHKIALRSYQRIEYQDPAFMPEVLPMVIACYEKIGEREALSQYLYYLMRHCPSITVVLANAEQVQVKQGEQQAAHFLANYMYKHPSIKGLKYLIEFHLSQVLGEVRNELLMLKSLIEQLLDNKPIYQCGHCGFASRILYWQCPSCRQWAAVKPIQGLEGE